MQLPITILAALTAALSATATPLAKRACQTTYPVAGLPLPISVSRTATPPSSQPATVSFSIPAGARGPCSLVLAFPAGYPVATTGSSQVDVVALDGPAAGAVVGTVALASLPGEAIVRTVNSFSCRPELSFRLQIAGAEGSVAFTEVEGAGLFVTYDC
ncbi:hypothetical protein QBC33DRAFT_511752 [Phialemonium atrogriseum]|uniref:Ubiquitin 3 binding protein But2 C-terminal domain-containing protein n=1 Tax=Phialemonium atrogriseum TaxID=1093897 RepID=A0AAJ0C694_9PEZI|nr:uncharacterized protein QBC33DRAFT_511752 [Phialemonium atrogriseum]KAK1770948.1 hypothetical protein QBC33DRAFT_511752 [Phialemonium atrogriseum]